MMRLGRRASLLVALFLLTSVATAYADCAWVLWSEESSSSLSYRTADANVPGASENSRDAQGWIIIGSYATNAACKNQQAWKIESMLKGWRKEKAEAKSGHTISHEPGSNIISQRIEVVGERTSSYWYSARYLCLPDTVDPRGPKAK
jgi:hypothetical protein